MALQITKQIVPPKSVRRMGAALLEAVADTTAQPAPLYVRVEQVSLTRHGATATIAAYDANDAELYRKSYDFECGMGAATPVAAAYEHLKTLPEYEGAEDV